MSGLDDGRSARSKESAALAEVWRSCLHLLTGVGLALMPERLPWRRRYFAGLRRLRDAGIATTADEDAGVMDYSSLRAQWDLHIVVLARYMAFDLHDVDPTTSDPEGVARRADFPRRLRSAG